jgi:hypothetical protein
VLETRGGSLNGGGCGGKRISGAYASESSSLNGVELFVGLIHLSLLSSFPASPSLDASLVMAALTAPSDGSDLAVYAGWAAGHATVNITPEIVLKGE